MFRGSSEMRNFGYIILLLILLTGCEKDVTYLQDRGGVKYEKNTEEPFTGKYVKYYQDGKKKLEEHYKDGKKDGLWTSWKTDGAKDFQLHFKDGKKDGLWTRWDKDEKISETRTYNNGALVK